MKPSVKRKLAQIGLALWASAVLASCGGRGSDFNGLSADENDAAARPNPCDHASTASASDASNPCHTQSAGQGSN